MREDQQKSGDGAPHAAARDIPSLDGLRAIAIGLVVLDHVVLGRVPRVAEALFGQLGRFGVLIFFTISGYLITTLLWREVERTGGLRIGRFFFRRTLRIFPPAYVYLALVALAIEARIGTPSPDARLWPAFLYVSNYWETRAWLAGHTWSLSIEEQYYLLWPLALLACLRWRGTQRGRAAAGVGVTVAVLVALPVLRLVVFGVTHDGAAAARLMFDFVAAGSALALVTESDAWPRGRAVLEGALRHPATPLAGLAAAALHLVFSDSIRWVFAADIVAALGLEAVLLALFVGWCVQNPAGRLGRLLNARAPRAVGRGSYSLYLWQQPFLPAAAGLQWPVALLAAAACAAASYWLVERPSLVMRAWLERRLVRSRPAVARAER